MPTLGDLKPGDVRTIPGQYELFARTEIKLGRAEEVRDDEGETQSPVPSRLSVEACARAVPCSACGLSYLEHSSERRKSVRADVACGGIKSGYVTSSSAQTDSKSATPIASTQNEAEPAAPTADTLESNEAEGDQLLTETADKMQNSPADSARFCATVFENSASKIPTDVRDGTWAEFVDLIERNGHTRTQVKDAAGLFGIYKLKSDTTRAKANVDQVFGWALDLDKATQEQIEQVIDRLNAAGLAYVLYTTFSHAGLKPKYRVVGPLAAPAAGKDWPPIWRAIIDAFAPKCSDEACKDCSRMYYFPSCPPDAVEDDAPLLVTRPGIPLDVRTLSIAQKPSAAASATPELNLNAREILDAGCRVEPCPRGRSIFEHAEHLASTMPAAISGQGGHVTTLRLARALVWGLGLEHDHARSILDKYNARCEPPWSDTELEHKLTAASSEDGAPYARGRLLPPPPDNFDHLPLIVQRDRNYWLRERDSNDYAIRVKEPDLVRICLDMHGEETLRTWNESDNPRVGKATIEKQSRVILALINCYHVARTTFDPESATLTEGLRPDPRLRAQEDPEVAAWLEALAGDDLHELKQWIAGCAQSLLMAPAPALGIVGPKSCGKSLIAAALARVWGDPCAPVSANVLVTQFNGDLARCPIVLADERLPSDMTGEDFRERVAARSHSVEPKHKERQTLNGSVRFVVTANNVDRVLGLAGEKNDNDLAAIAERWRLIEIDDARAALCIEALERLKVGDDGSNVDLARIARHFLWLQETVKPHRGRFVGSPPDHKILKLLRASEARRNMPEIFELVRDYVETPLGWEKSYSGLDVTPRMNMPDTTAKTAWPLIVAARRLFARPIALATIVGNSSKAVISALRPFTVGERLKQKLKLATKELDAQFYELDTAKLSDALGFDSATLARALEQDTNVRRTAAQQNSI
ncbi:MAG TPA: primase-helicase family protein [Polyangiaceae bacterium]